MKYFKIAVVGLVVAILAGCGQGWPYEADERGRYEIITGDVPGMASVYRVDTTSGEVCLLMARIKAMVSIPGSEASRGGMRIRCWELTEGAQAIAQYRERRDAEAAAQEAQ